MKLFISYAHVDKFLVNTQIVDILTSAGHSVWFDERLVVGGDWKKQLADEIANSDALVYVMTPESVASEWCQWELKIAVEKQKPIVPVLLQERTPLPDSLRNIQFVDFSRGATGDAVARLLGGLQRLSNTQVAFAPTNPKGTPTEAMSKQPQQNSENQTPPSPPQHNNKVSDPAIRAAYIGGAFLIASVLIAGLFGLFQGVFSNSTPQPTHSSTVTDLPIATHTNTPRIPTITDMPTLIPTTECIGTIKGTGSKLNQVKILPNPSSTARAPVQRGSSVVILATTQDFGTVWYQIRYAEDDDPGWISEEHINVPPNCP